MVSFIILSLPKGEPRGRGALPKHENRAWQRMLSGRRLDLLDPSPLDIELSDIAHGLARVARWNGQTRGDHAFSVAQHSVLVLGLFQLRWPDQTPSEGLFALLHDAPEYVMGDIISPFKTAMGGNYKAVEERLLHAVHLRFALPADPPERLRKRIKQADREAAYFEAVRLAGFAPEEALEFFGAPGPVALAEFEEMMRPWPAALAQQRFTGAFESLAGSSAPPQGAGVN